MSIETILSQLGLTRQNPNSLEAQLHSMRREVRRIGRSLSRNAGHATDDWAENLSDLSRDAARYSSHFAQVAGDQARRSAAMVGRDPLPLIAVIGTGLLLARLLQRR